MRHRARRPDPSSTRDARPNVICKGMLGMALFATVAVACSTVRLQLESHLRTYELAQLRDSIEELGEVRDVVRARVLALHAPERVHAAAERLREQRRATAAAHEAARNGVSL